LLCCPLLALDFDVVVVDQLGRCFVQAHPHHPHYAEAVDGLFSPDSFAVLIRVRRFAAMKEGLPLLS
jgi:hypothetical protein